MLLNFFYAFIGGMILNVMPCVLPVLTIKILHVLDHPRSKAVLGAVQYTAGVMLTFFFLSVIMILLGDAVGWGYQMQSPVFVIFLAYLTFVLGLNLSGLFELSYFFANNSGATGFVTTLLATPCTAPFMALAVGFAASQPAVINILIFQFVALGMAFPYLFIVLFPRFYRLLPKPGEWMITFKKIAAVPMYLTSIWLVWVLIRIVGDEILMPLALCFAILGLMFLVRGALSEKHRLLRLFSAVVAVALCVFIPFYALNKDSTQKLSVMPFSPGVLQTLVKHGQQPVFLAFAADWCIPCQINKKILMGSSKIKSFFDSKDVIYMEADYTNRDPKIVSYLRGYGRSGVPAYILYYADMDSYVLLDVVFTENSLIEQMSRFIDHGEQKIGGM